MPPRLKPSAPLEHQVYEWRKHQNMTLQQVADAIGSTKGHLSRIENGHVTLTAETAAMLASLFGIDSDTLWRRKPSEGPDPERELLSIFRGLSDKAKETALTSIRAIASLDRRE